jgi:hypothetical protein
MISLTLIVVVPQRNLFHERNGGESGHTPYLETEWHPRLSSRCINDPSF